MSDILKEIPKPDGTVYELETLADVVKLPKGAFDRCLEELSGMLLAVRMTVELAETIASVTGVDDPVSLEGFKTNWNDDGKGKVSLNIHGLSKEQ